MVTKSLNHYINQIDNINSEIILDYRNTYPNENTVKVKYQPATDILNKIVFNVYVNNVVESISWVCGSESGSDEIFYVSTSNPNITTTGVILTVNYLDNEDPNTILTYTNTYFPLNPFIPILPYNQDSNLLVNDSDTLYVYNQYPIKGITKINNIFKNINDLKQKQAKITFTNISNNDYIQLNDYFIYFKTVPINTNDIQIGITITSTINSLKTYLDNSTNIQLLNISSYTLELNSNSEYDLILYLNNDSNVTVNTSFPTFTPEFIRLNDYKLYMSVFHDVNNITSLNYIDVSNINLINSTFFTNVNYNQKRYFIFKLVKENNQFDLLPSDSDFISDYLFNDSFYFSDISISVEYNSSICDGIAHKFDKSGQCTLFTPKDLYKVFGLTSFDVKAYGITNERYLSIKFRYSITNGQSWSNFMILNDNNLKTIPFSGLKFFKIEFNVCREGSDNTGYILLYGIDLIGDIQNVSKDYLTLNRMGIVCSGNLVGENACSDSININGLSDYNTVECCENELFNPYQLDGMLTLYNDLANTVSKTFGFEVDYFKTTSDVNGTDTYLHEYQLFHRQAPKKLKILVPENNFPEDKIQMSHFDFGLLDTFEIHIVKEEFKRVFGVEFQPERNDHLLLCDVNRMYQVESAQPVRAFMNTSIYYRVMLVKYDDKKNIKSDSVETEEIIQNLTGKNSLNNLFGIENDKEEVKIVKPKQNKPKSIDKLRMNINSGVKYIEEQLYNGSVIFSESQYNLNGVAFDTPAITYTFNDNEVIVGQNRSIMFWFNLNEFTNDNYGFINNYDELNNVGYKLNMLNKSFSFKYNGQLFNLNVKDIITADKWYCLLLNIDTQNNVIEYFIYKRKYDSSSYANVADLELVVKRKFSTFIPADFTLSDDSRIKFNGSNSHITNIRVFNEIVEEESHKLVCNRLIVKDEQLLILADNCNKKFNIRNYPSKNFKMDDKN